MALPRVLPGHSGRLQLALGLGLVLAGVNAIGVAAQPVGGAREPLQLFDAMMPVLSHPRCTNCHGGVNAITGDNHPGGEVSDVPVDEQGNMLAGTLSNEQCRRVPRTWASRCRM